jgi:uncharacterized protein YutE (UPF0331/DUF86 family)
VADRDLITRKIALILDDFRGAAAIAEKPLSEYLTSKTDELVTERYLERMIGRMIDINYHLITDGGHAPPHDYYESFIRLGTLGILPPAFASQIAACAGLRNRLVHEYDAIEPSLVYAGLQAALRDIPEYLQRINAHLETTS